MSGTAAAAPVPAPAPASIQLTAAQLQAIVQTAVQAAIAAAQPGPPAQPVFALVPGGGDPNTPWNFTSGDGLKLFQAATKGFDKRFDGDMEKLQYFLDALQERAMTYGMDGILRVNIGTTAAPEYRMLTSEYGSISEAQMRVHALTYQALDGRLRQSSATLISLISNSVSPELLDELKQKSYTVSVQVGNPPAQEERHDGPLMLYQLIMLVSVDTRATVATLLKQLTGSGMSIIMEEVKSDIHEFNKKVNMKMIALRARRREVPDCVPALFEAYQVCEDSTFTKYIGRKEEEYEDKTIATMSNKSLMEMALEKYKTLNEKGLWKKKTKEQLEFIALKSELETARKQLVQKPLRETKKAVQSKQGPRNDGEWAWKSVAPKEGESHAKAYKGKDYVYCPHHGDTKWVLKVNNKGVEHNTGCRAKQQANSGSSVSMTASTKGSTASPAKTPSKPDRDMVIAKALAAVYEDELSALTEENIATPSASGKI
jgi:hypothetical protein